MERIAQIRGLGPKHQYAIMCCDLSDIATYAKVDNAMYRLLKIYACCHHVYFAGDQRSTQAFNASEEKTIGLRIPSNPVAQALLKDSVNRY